MDSQASAQEISRIAGILSSQSLTNIVTGIILLLIGIILIKFIMRLVDKVLDNAHAIPAAIHAMLRSGIRWTLCFLCLVIVAGTMGIQISSFVAIFSVIGIAISLAVQGILSNLVGGLIILFSKPFVPKDFIEVNDVTGTVLETGILLTKLRSPDGKIHQIPNSTIYTSRTTNFTVHGQRRIELKVSASYDNTPDQVREAILDAVSVISKNPKCGVLETPEPNIMLESYDDSAITYNIWIWCVGSTFVQTKYALNEELYSSFARHGVIFTYPHLNIHMTQRN